MAELFYNPAIEKTEGALSKGGLITRQKTFRDARGRIIAYGKLLHHHVRAGAHRRTPPQTRFRRGVRSLLQTDETVLRRKRSGLFGQTLQYTREKNATSPLYHTSCVFRLGSFG